jgi:hypothetical protein
MLAQKVSQIGARAEHADAVNPHVLLARVIIYEANWRRAQPGISLQLSRDQLTGVSGADDDHLATAREEPAAAGALDQRAGN